VPVYRIPHAIDKGPGPFYERPFFDLPDAAFLFLTMYDTHSVMARKNPEGAIAAFRSAFSPADSTVGLVLKINNLDKDEGERLQSLIGAHRNIHVIDRTLTRHEVDSLLACADCFVSLHRAEGFGLPIAEAMALGRPVIATNWSGNVDFMDHTCAACVDFRLQPVGKGHEPYDATQHWAEPDLDSAARWMRTLVGDPAVARRIGHAARERVHRQLSPAAVGGLIRARLADIHRGSGDPRGTGSR
jgi:glycosyltransferase involved in cell wall biosynthesis